MTADPVDPVDPVEAVGVAVAGVVERIFGTVSRVHAAVLRSTAGHGLVADRPLLRDDDVRDLLHEPGQLAVGLGLVVAPQPAAGRPLRLEWWQAESSAGTLRRLEPDLRPSSLGYYDYTSTPWFEVPQRTGRRHVVGPYVDVHGTGRYVLTVTEPVVVDGVFVGVAGADVPVRRFEGYLMAVPGGLPRDVVVLNDEGRVVLSTAPRVVVGSLVEPVGGARAGGRPVPGVPWRLHHLGDGGLPVG